MAHFSRAFRAAGDPLPATPPKMPLPPRAYPPRAKPRPAVEKPA